MASMTLARVADYESASQSIVRASQAASCEALQASKLVAESCRSLSDFAAMLAPASAMLKSISSTIGGLPNYTEGVKAFFADQQELMKSLAVSGLQDAAALSSISSAAIKFMGSDVSAEWARIPAGSILSGSGSDLARAMSGAILQWPDVTGSARISSMLTEPADRLWQNARALGSLGQAWRSAIDPRQFIAGFESVLLASAGLKALVEQWKMPGTVSGDLFLLTRANVAPGRKEAALHRLADRVAWKIHSSAVRATLSERARASEISFHEAKHREICAAILLVLDTRDRPQFHRFGRHWLVDEDGRRVAVAPNDLEVDLYLEWFWNEVREAAEASVLERPFPAPFDVMDRTSRGEPLCVSIFDDNREIAYPDADPLALLVERETVVEDERRLLAAPQAATPRQRELLSLIAVGATVPEAARRLNMASSTARVQLSRLRQRIA